MSFNTAISRIFARLGSLATYTPVSGPVVDGIYVVYEQQSEIQAQMESGVIQIAPTIEYIIDDLGLTAKSGDTFTIGSTVYTAGAQVSNDGITAMVMVK